MLIRCRWICRSDEQCPCNQSPRVAFECLIDKYCVWLGVTLRKPRLCSLIKYRGRRKGFFLSQCIQTMCYFSPLNLPKKVNLKIYIHRKEDKLIEYVLCDVFVVNLVGGVIFQNLYSQISCLISIEDIPNYCLFQGSYYLYELQK